MGFFDRFRRSRVEKRSAMSGFTAELMAARESYISGRRGIAELTATAQSCVSLWENAFSLADVEPANVMDRATMAMIARSLALRGEAVFYISEGDLIPCADWDLKTKWGEPIAYRLSISEAGGGETLTALAGEVLHVRIGLDPSVPWAGQAPLRRAHLTASMLNAVESALAETFENAPIGSQVVPMPEMPDTDMSKVGAQFRAQRGRVVLRESVQVSAAGGPAPATDWRPVSLSPDLQRSMSTETLAAGRDAICAAFGVLPALFASNAQGPLVREAQRHLAQWTLSPIAALLAEEATEKLGVSVTVDVMRPLQAFDAGSRSRAMLAVVQALAMAKQGDIAPADIAKALDLVDWE